MSTVVLLPLAEIGLDLSAKDKTGNVFDFLGDPAASPELVAPAIISGTLTGRGRVFGGDIGMVAKESVADVTRLTRDCTIRAFVRYEIDNAIDGDTGVIVSRGLRDGTGPERQLFSLEVERIDSATLSLRMVWEEADGTEAATAGKEFIPQPNEFIFVAAARTWISETEVKVEYVVNGVDLGSEVVSAGNIGEGVDGTIIVGARGAGVSAYERFLPTDTVIDSLSIENDAMSVEELRQDYRRLVTHQPNGYLILRSYIPPGDCYSRDENSKFRRWLKAEGAGLGLTLALAERYRDDFLPDRAYGDILKRWESLLGFSPSPIATIADRRETIVEHFSNPLGFSYQDIKNALADSLGLAPADVAIYEFTGYRSDDFSTDDITSPPSSLWATHAGNGVIGVSGGTCNITSTATDNISYYLIDGGRASYREASLAPMGEEISKECFIAADTTLNAGHGQDVLAGVFIRNHRGDSLVFCGLMDRGAGQELVYFQEDSDGRSSIQALGPTGSNYKPYLARKPTLNEYEAGYIDGAGNRVPGDDIEGPGVPGWLGFGCFGVNRTPGAADASFADADIFEKNSTRGQDFIVYVNPALSTGYNLELARKIIEEKKPAHTNAYVVDDLSGLKLGAGFIRLLPLQPRI